MPFMKAKERARREKVKELCLKRNAKVRELKEARARVGSDYTVVSVGRRVVDLALLASNLWCQHCNIALSLKFLEEEKQFGLASEFSVRCPDCLLLRTFNTSNSVSCPSGDGRSLYSVNCKAALGCLDSGVGHDQFNKLFSAMNMPTIRTKTMKRAEERVGRALVEVADDSCREAIAEEKELTLAAKRLLTNRENSAVSPAASGAATPTPATSRTPAASGAATPTPATSRTPAASGAATPTPAGKGAAQSTPRVSHIPISVTIDASEDDDVPICVRFDFGWDKRGNGFQYNSHSGRGSIIGEKCKKILGYDVLSKYCKLCERGYTAESHVCVKNYQGSSKGMEPVSAVKLVVNNPNLHAAGVKVTKFIGDRDSSTMAALRKASPHPIQKIIDMNHNTKSVNNKLWKLKKGKHTFLTSDIINYLKKCVSYAITQNKDDVEGVRKAILQIEFHVFGEHENCGEWCNAKKPGYVYKNLPKNQPFSCPIWRQDLRHVLVSQADEAEQLAPAGSTQLNESFNHMVVTRAPKGRHYAGTESNLFRVAAAVSWKNNGPTHLERVHEKLNLSPSVSDFRTRLAQTLLARRVYQTLPVVKRRRLFIKNRSTWTEASAEKQTGLTYVSGMSSSMERATSAATVSSWIPQPSVLLPACKVVIVDIETTGFAATDSVIQLAAKCEEQTFSAYMLPLKPIHPRATEATGFRLQAGKLWRNNSCMDTVDAAEVCQQFLTFMKQCGSQIILVGHNIKSFDMPRILKLFTSHGYVKEFCDLVFGFTDTLNLIKQGSLKKQDALASEYLKGPEWEPLVRSAHDALSDCLLLDGLLKHFGISEEMIVKNVNPLRDYLENQAVKKKKMDILPTLHPLIDQGISKIMAGKMAAAGVTVGELKKEFEEHGRKGLEVCLGVRVNGKPRVTTSQPIINKIEEFVKTIL